MRPNKQGGQTFNRREIGIARNALYQASWMVKQMDPETCDTGHCPAYRRLEHVFDNLGMKYVYLESLLDKTRQRVESEEFDAQPFVASISETQVVMSCVKWMTDPEAYTDKMSISARQIAQAQRMVGQFEGTASV